MPCRAAALDRLLDHVRRRLGEAAKMPPVWNQRTPSVPKRWSQSTSPGRSCEAAVWPRSETPTRAADAEAALGEVEPVAHRAADAVDGTQRISDVSTPPWRTKSSSSRPTSLSAKAVTTAVRSPKQRRSPRATLYSPPPSQTRNERAVRIAALARVEAQHDLAQRDQVVPALLGRADRESHRASASLRSALDLVQRPAEMRAGATIQLPPIASTSAARGSPAFCALRPPVGTNRASGNGAARARTRAAAADYLGREELDRRDSERERRR